MIKGSSKPLTSVPGAQLSLEAESLLINSIGQRPMRNGRLVNFQAESLKSKRLRPFRACVLSLLVHCHRAMPYAIDFTPSGFYVLSLVHCHRAMPYANDYKAFSLLIFICKFSVHNNKTNFFNQFSHSSLMLTMRKRYFEQKKAESLLINSVGQRPTKNGSTHKTTSPERA